MDSERNAETRTTDIEKEEINYKGISIPPLHIVIEPNQMKNILELYDLNHAEAGLDALWKSFRRVITERVKERFNVDLE